jgi:hypothetical protein
VTATTRGSAAPAVARPVALEERRCALVSRAIGEDPIGMAGTFDRYVCVERPLPWPKNLWQPSQLPPGLAALAHIPLWVESAGADGTRVRALAIAPDDVYSRDGHTTILVFARPAGPFAAFERHEYTVPHALLPVLLAPLFEPHLPPAGPRALVPYRVEQPAPVRDLLVCTHGTVDGCCAHLGYPAYRALRHDLAPRHPWKPGDAGTDGGLRVWRVSHFGGHRLAPTLIDWPEGRWWAFLGPETLTALARRDGDPAALRGCYRGWGGLSFFGQVAERELLARHGWEWTTYRVAERLLEVDGAPAERLPSLKAYPQFGADAPREARVRLEFTTPGGDSGTFEATVERRDTLTTILGECDTGAERHPRSSVAQYRVVA